MSLLQEGQQRGQPGPGGTLGPGITMPNSRASVSKSIHSTTWVRLGLCEEAESRPSVLGVPGLLRAPSLYRAPSLRQSRSQTPCVCPQASES